MRRGYFGTCLKNVIQRLLRLISPESGLFFCESIIRNGKGKNSNLVTVHKTLNFFYAIVHLSNKVNTSQAREMVVQNNTVVVKVLKTFPFKNESFKISCNVICVCRHRPFFGSTAYHDFLISARQSRFMYKNNMSISLDFSTAKNRTENLCI